MAIAIGASAANALAVPGEREPALPGDAQLAAEGLLNLPFVAQEIPPLPVLPPLESAAAARPAEPLPTAEAAVPDPQQWLSVMLSQQAVQVQARDYSGGQPNRPMPMPVGERLLPLPMSMAAPVLEVPGEVQAELGELFTQVGADAQARHAQPGPGKVAGLFDSLLQASPLVPTVQRSLAGPAGLPGADTAALATPPPSPAAAVPVALPGAALPAPAEVSLEHGLKLAAPQARWGEQMLHALRETVEVQVQQRFQQATIRLDPPELGSLEIFISHESGRLNVQISAAHSDVTRLLQNTSDRLRQELVGQSTLQVNVQIAGDGQGQSGREQSRRGHDPQIGEALQDELGATQLGNTVSSDVLVTV